eukprot:557276-Prymnesium_polylepis.1
MEKEASETTPETAIKMRPAVSSLACCIARPSMKRPHISSGARRERIVAMYLRAHARTRRRVGAGDSAMGEGGAEQAFAGHVRK